MLLNLHPCLTHFTTGRDKQCVLGLLDAVFRAFTTGRFTVCVGRKCRWSGGCCAHQGLIRLRRESKWLQLRGQSLRWQGHSWGASQLLWWTPRTDSPITQFEKTLFPRGHPCVVRDETCMPLCLLITTGMSLCLLITASMVLKVFISCGQVNRRLCCCDLREGCWPCCFMWAVTRGLSRRLLVISSQWYKWIRSRSLSWRCFLTINTEVNILYQAKPADEICIHMCFYTYYKYRYVCTCTHKHITHESVCKYVHKHVPAYIHFIMNLELFLSLWVNMI